MDGFNEYTGSGLQETVVEEYRIIRKNIIALQGADLHEMSDRTVILVAGILVDLNSQVKEVEAKLDFDQQGLTNFDSQKVEALIEDEDAESIRQYLESSSL